MLFKELLYLTVPTQPPSTPPHFRFLRKWGGAGGRIYLFRKQQNDVIIKHPFDNEFRGLVVFGCNENIFWCWVLVPYPPFGPPPHFLRKWGGPVQVLYYRTKKQKNE